MGGERVRAALAAALAAGPAAAAEPGLALWGVQAEQIEHRRGEDGDVLAWDGEAFAGTDELKLVVRSEGEYGLDEDAFEKLESQLRLQAPVSDFFDAAVGVRADTPEGPDRLYGVLGLKGLAPQWFEIDADLYLSDRPFFEVEAEYEALITNRIVLTPTVTVDLPLADDDPLDRSAFDPSIEAGARLSYDLIDRAVAPYVGVHYERDFGDTGADERAEGGDRDAWFFVAGARLMF
jgi:copper resistance protein B